ncbi:MAG: alanine:cation symporter family protein [Alphaproteobacteria bacterium]|nr:alanine:cation symporter family protein [Alphaproteobacteria bacterium]
MPENFDARINAALSPLTNAVSNAIFYAVPFGESEVKLIVVWLIIVAISFTLYFRFINIWGFAHAIAIVRGKYRDPSQPGEVSHFRALTAALSGTVGLGNIAGVAVAIALGGPGATVWMIAAGFFGMASKFAECTLGVKYRVLHEDGTVSGGPMFYLSRGLAELGLGRLGRGLAAFFAMMCIGGAIGAGNMFQANQAYQQFVNATGGEHSFFYNQGWLFGLILAIVVGLVILGGIKSIAGVTARVVPFMGSVYMLAGLVIVIMNADLVPAAVTTIVHGAFTPEAGFGGLIGVLMMGVQRATFSNEAGVGSAPIAYASVQTSEPVSVGFVSLLEPFVDTIIICTMTALVIVLSGVYLEKEIYLDGNALGGVLMTSAAFARTIDWFPYVLALAVMLFAFSTIITWSYYGLKCWTYLFGKTRVADHTFKIMFLCFTVVGSAMGLGSIIAFSDAMIFAMTFPNAIGLYLLAGKLRADLRSYWTRVKTGEIAPTK